MRRLKICAVIVSGDLAVVRKAEESADLLELRIDLVGDGWQELAGQFNRPWIACNRRAAEGGKWDRGEVERVDELLKALEMGADVIDIELDTEELAEAVRLIKQQARCLLSFHDGIGTPSIDGLKEIVRRQLAAGADICKVVTTARSFEDNLIALRLMPEFPDARVISFTMGPLGWLSRALCPLVGADFTYASMEEGLESAPGQITVAELVRLYDMVAPCQ